MTKKILTVTTMILLTLPSVVHAQSPVAGTWRGKTPNGFQLELDLTATDKALTGTLTRDHQPIAITDGKVSNNTFTFRATMNDQKEPFTGEVDGDQIKLWMDRQGPAMAAVLKRVVDVKQNVRERLTGKWQGATVSGRPLVLDIKVAGQQLTGRLILAEHPADITEGKVEGETFSLKAGTVDGPVVARGRLVGEELQFMVEGIENPLTLKRVK